MNQRDRERLGVLKKELKRLAQRRPDTVLSSACAGLPMVNWNER